MKKLKKMQQRQPYSKLHYLWGMVLLLLIIAPANAELIVLSYHEVNHIPNQDQDFTSMTVETSELAAQFSWLKEHGYKSVKIDDLLAAQEGKRPLPDKAVLLTFDDGYLGMYEQVYPLLRAFDYYAVIAIMGDWLETPTGEKVKYGNETVARKYFLNWAQVREMVSSGRVEVASHSYDLHRGIITNPQGNTQPAAVSRHYDRNTNRYESDEQYRQRIHNDLQRNSDLIARKTGHQPRVMVWPYGVYNRITIDIARELGMPVTMSLEEDEGKKINTQNLSSVNRLLIGHNTTLTNFVRQINEYYKPKTQPMRTVFLDLNEIYDPNPKKQEENLGRILDQVKALNANTVYLQAFTDADGNGSADTLYFPNRHLPVRADLFSRVSWQLRTRTGVKVYAWLPVFAYDRPNDPLLSFPNQKTLDFVSDIYEDLSKYTHIDGLLFHGETNINDHQALAQWIDTLARRARIYRPTLKTTRNMYAPVMMKPASGKGN